MSEAATIVAMILTIIVGVPVMGAFLVVGLDKLEDLIFKLWR